MPTRKYVFLTRCLLVLTLSQVIHGEDNRGSAMFEVIHNPYMELTSMFHKSFHQCSKSSPCNFVVKDMTTNKYETHNKEGDITQDRRKLIIWKRKRKYSCLDWRYDSAMINGIYRISDDDGVEFNVYCDFISEPNSVWTLIESFSLGKNHLFKDWPFTIDFPYLEDSPNWDNYRLSKTRMEKIKSTSTHWRATCSFDIFEIKLMFAFFDEEKLLSPVATSHSMLLLHYLFKQNHYSKLQMQRLDEFTFGINVDVLSYLLNILLYNSKTVKWYRYHHTLSTYIFFLALSLQIRY
ncbi:uncharacterized protein LOC135680801 isoform X2 [Rhopilema esculentum]|uniref:uncharacterized protein LOC135680801 isoform X2 n=1 Tax=Rhopilema esculentum TaxID=499914 RepID=UPI0031D4B086